MIQVTTHERIATVVIDRPDRRNAVDSITAEALHDAFVAIDDDPDVDVAILTGAGGTFCAGADLQALADGDRADLPEWTMGPMGPTRLSMTKPVIAAIEGHAVAGGLELAVWADLRVMADDAVLGVFCRRFGVPLIDLGTVRLPRLVGQGRAMDLILTGREVGADEALAMGLVSRVVPTGTALSAAEDLARLLVSHPQACMRSDRQSVLDQWSLPWDAATMNEFSLGLVTIRSGETLAGATAFRDGAGRHGEAR